MDAATFVTTIYVWAKPMDTSRTLLMKVRDTRDGESWRRFVAVYEPLITGYARARGLDAAEASDVAQEVFFKLVKSLHTFDLSRGRGKFRAWLRKVTVNEVIDRLRKNGARVIAENERLGALPTPEGEWEEARRWVLHRALQEARSYFEKRNERHWVCFEQHVLGRRPAAEVAAELEVSANVVYINCSRVLERVRQACKELMGDLLDD